MVTISERKISEIKAYVTDAGVECVPVYNFGPGGTLEPDTDVDIIDNLIWGGTSVVNAGTLSFSESVSGTGADAYSTNIGVEGDTGSIIGICGSGGVNNRLSLYTGIVLGILSNRGVFFFGTNTYTYTFFAEVNSLGTSTTDEYYTAHGFGDNLSHLTSTNGAWFEYGVGRSVNWEFRTSKAGVATSIDTGIPVVADTLYKFKIVVQDVDGTLTAYGYIDDILVATSTTNIPNTNSNSVGLIHKIIRQTATSTDRDFKLRKYIRLQINFPNGR